MNKLLSLLVFVVLLQLDVNAQSDRFKNYPSRSVGPVIQGARIVDIAVNPSDQHEFYIGFASGGVFKTINNGMTFFPVFDEQGSITIGDMAIAPSEPSIIYVGTGENNSSRSSYAGDGIYRSNDGGSSWTNIGLPNTQHIGRILVHPNDPNVVWVAAMGGLYSDNPERGVYKTTDAGKSWVKVLYLNEKTGAIDLVLDPEDPNILYASLWERKRYAWDFVGNGKGSGVYKSTDGGNTWSKSMKGIPNDEFTGRIGLTVSQSNPSTLYAVLDYQKESKEKVDKDQSDELSLNEIGKLSVDEFLALDNDKLDDFLKEKGFPKRYNSINVKKEIFKGVYTPKDLANYFGDANEALFNTTIAGAIVYRSDDKGESWNRTHEYDLEGVFYTYGYYFGEIRVSPADPNEIYVLGVPLVKSTDGGKTFHRTDTIGGVHSDHQSMWINPKNPKHIILGNDGGLYISYDRGASWDHRNNMSVGQFYTVNVDNAKPYNIYGGLQDNGTLVGSSRTVPAVRGQWERLFGGDGMYVSADPRNKDVVYVGYQFGNYYRIDRASGQSSYITPSHNIGEDKLRFNWRTPVLLSTHNPEILYLGSQKVHRSLDMGESWEEISDDLTKGGKDGNVPFGTITEIAESPLRFGLLYVGTDDGNIWRYTTKQGWKQINGKLPKDLWVSSIHPSVHDEKVVYLTLTGYRKDDFTTYVYRSDNAGESWTSIKGKISNEAVNVVYEDLVHPSLLYLGTDNGTYLSMNAGADWERIHQIPNVASYDMVIQAREQELVVGTHGRSVYVVDLKPIHSVLEKGSALEWVTMKPASIRFSDSWGTKRYPYLDTYYPEITFELFTKHQTGKWEIHVMDENEKVIAKLSEKLSSPGFHQINWNGKQTEVTDKFIQKGKYKVKFIFNGKEIVEDLEVK